MKKIIPEPKSKFLKVVCSNCNNEQIIFNKASTSINCLVCGAELALTSGGKSKIKAKVVQVL